MVNKLITNIYVYSLIQGLKSNINTLALFFPILLPEQGESGSGEGQSTNTVSPLLLSSTKYIICQCLH